jgi:hypothetical protein
MKGRVFTMGLTLMAMLAATGFGQPITPASGISPSATPGTSANLRQTVSGRIVRLDLRSNVISVRANDTGKVIDLRTDQQTLMRLRRGQRVIVTYSGNRVTNIQATRLVR